jgi:TonB family protein
MTEAWKQCEGQVVDGKFHLRQYVGGSDHSAVFLTEVALQAALKAAIKFIPVDAENSETQISQWQLAAKLSHPHLIQIFDAGRCQLGGRDLLFVVSEFAEENLAQIIPQRALASGEVQDMLPPVLDVLSYIHRQGLVHGHLKPANIMAVHDQLKISSDGIRTAGESGKKLQEAGVYAAPEIATGVTPAADVWSLGMTLVEVLTQRPLLWDGRGEPVVPENVPSPFRNIASHCLRQDPERRWTIAEIAGGVQSPDNRSRKPAQPESSSSASGNSPKRSRLIGPVVAVAILVAAIIGGRKLLSHPNGSEQSALSTPSSSVAPPSSDTAPQKPPAPEPVPTAPPASHHSSKNAKAAPSSAGSSSVVQQVLPDVSRSARHTIQGRIRTKVRVNVDASGSVVAAKLESAGPSQYFANKSLEAARKWKFAPSQPTGSVWVLKFAIGRTSTSVQSAQTKP